MARGLAAPRCGLPLELSDVLVELFNLAIGLLFEFIKVIAQIVKIIARAVKIVMGFVMVLACLVKCVLELIIGVSQQGNLGREQAPNLIITLCFGGKQ